MNLPIPILKENKTVQSYSAERYSDAEITIRLCWIQAICQEVCDSKLTNDELIEIPLEDNEIQCEVGNCKSKIARSVCIRDSGSQSISFPNGWDVIEAILSEQYKNANEVCDIVADIVEGVNIGESIGKLEKIPINFYAAFKNDQWYVIEKIRRLLLLIRKICLQSASHIT